MERRVRSMVTEIERRVRSIVTAVGRRVRAIVTGRRVRPGYSNNGPWLQIRTISFATPLSHSFKRILTGWLPWAGCSA